MVLDNKQHIIRIRLKGAVSEVLIDKDEFTIGREVTTDVQIPHKDISRKHILVKINGDQIFVRDLGSSNGTTLSNKPLPPMHDILISNPDDQLCLGDIAVITIIPKSLSARKEEHMELVIPGFDTKPDAVKEEPYFVKSALPPTTPQPVPEGEGGVPLLDNIHRQADLILERAKRSAEDIHAKALAHTTQMKAEADLDVERIKEAGRKEAETIRSEILQDVHVQQAQLDQIKTELATLGFEKKTSLKEIERLNEEQKNILVEVSKARTQFNELNLEYKTVTHERDELQGRLGYLQKKIEESEAHHLKIKSIAAENESQIATFEHKRQQINQEIAVLNGKTEAFKKETSIREDELKRINIALKDMQETYQKTIETQNTEDRKRKINLEIAEAEYKNKNLHLEALLREIDIKRLDAEKELQLVINRKKQVEEETNGLKAEANRTVVEAQEKVKKGQNDLHATLEEKSRQENLIEGLKIKAKDYELSISNLEKSCEESKQKVAETQQEILKMQSELDVRKSKIESEISALKERLAAEEREAHEKLQLEIGGLRKEAKDKIDAEVAQQKRAIEADFERKAKAMEQQLLEASQKEMKRIQQLEEEEKKSSRTRTGFMIDDITRHMIELSQQKSLDKAEGEIRGLVKNVLEGKSAAVQNAKIVEKTRDFWRTIAKKSAGPVLVLLTLMIFPSLPKKVWNGIQRSIASKEDDSSVFLQQIRQNSMKYMPPMDRTYRSTYSDNILYLEGYVQIKLDEDIQNRWTLQLNAFLTKELELSDRIIPDFMATETVMIKNLYEIRQNILPKFKEQGLARMAEAEKEDVRRLMELLSNKPENYERFRNFEQKFFEEAFAEKLKVK